MYSGTTFRRHSGWMLGVHQRIDRVARRHLTKLLPATAQFPSNKLILHFEGNNGPDGIKRKSPSVDEPWHFINPRDPSDRQLIRIINDHYNNLVMALQQRNEERSAFEAAWLSHAIVDGLTPAHHYPLSDKIMELWGKPHHERSSVKDKNIIKGTTRRDTISKNWQYWGGGGIFSRHLFFESGVAMSIAGYRFNNIGINKHEVTTTYDIEKLFLDSLRTIDQLGMYDEFGKTGWTQHLANETRKVLLPVIIKTVCLAWYSAVNEATKK